MQGLKNGEYIRTKQGYICKVKERDEFHRITFERWEDTIYITDNKIGEVYRFSNRDIARHGFNIIDVIEKDDYVNGCRVYKVGEGVTVYQKTDDSLEGITDYDWIHKSDIKSIVTKEQFNSIKYVIGE